MTGVLWTQEEDDELRRLVEVHGAKAWSKIAKDLGTKGSKQCRRRWKNFLNMNAKTCGWSAEEDEQLIEAHRRCGNKWTEISRMFGDRTDNAVKNRWAALVKKNPRLADDESSGTATAPPSKRQRVGEATTTTTSGYNPYSSGALQHAQHMQPHYGPVLGHFQGQPLSAMPTPFDQNLLIQPQQHHQLMSAQMQQQAQAHAQAAFAPLSIVVNKGLLSTQELALVEQINQAHAPVHIEVAERLVGADAGSAGSDPLVDVRDVTRRPSWHQFMDSLDTEPPPSHLSDILNWFNSGGAQQQQQQQQNPQLPPGRRLTRSLSRQGGSGGAAGAPNRSESLTDAHRHLLVRLISKGLEARTASEQAELDLLGLTSVTALDNHVNDFTAGAAAAAGAAGAGTGAGAGAAGARVAGIPGIPPIPPMPAGWGAGPAAAAAGMAAAAGASPGAAGGVGGVQWAAWMLGQPARGGSQQVAPSAPSPPNIARRGSGGARMDPLRRTRSSQRREAEASAAAAAVGAGLGGDHLLHTGFPGFPASGNLAAPAAAVVGAAPAPVAAGGGGPAALTRRMSSFRGRDGMPQINPNELFGDVLLTPTFTSQEIAMLLDALTPAAGSNRGH